MPNADQHIRLHKKLAQILERLTSQAETESRARAEHFDSLLRQSAEKAQSLTQQTDRLAERDSQVDQLVSNMLQSKSKVPTTPFTTSLLSVVMVLDIVPFYIFLAKCIGADMFARKPSWLSMTACKG